MERIKKEVEMDRYDVSIYQDHDWMEEELEYLKDITFLWFGHPDYKHHTTIESNSDTTGMVEKHIYMFGHSGRSFRIADKGSPKTCQFDESIIGSIWCKPEDLENITEMFVRLFEGNYYSATVYDNLKEEYVDLDYTTMQIPFSDERLGYFKSNFGIDLETIKIEY